MLEVFVTCLSRYAVFLKDKELLEEYNNRKSVSTEVSPIAPERKKRLSIRQDSLIRDPKQDDEEEELGSLIMEGLTALLNGNASNCNVFRDCGGAKCVHGMVVHEACRNKALGKLFILHTFLFYLYRAALLKKAKFSRTKRANVLCNYSYVLWMCQLLSLYCFR